MSDLSSTLSPSSQSQQPNPPLDVQHGVIIDKLWPIKMVDGHPTTVLKFCFLDGTDKRKSTVRTTVTKSARDDAKKKYGSPGPNNPFDFVTWEDCANVKFEELTIEDKADSNIRITFTGKGFQSQIGTRAERFPDGWTTMLAGLEDEYPPSKEDRAIILHEFGHALGLAHEHQGPAAKNYLELNEDLVKQCYGEAAEGQILKEVDHKQLWNYTSFNPTSIMIYEIDKAWQTQQKKKIQIKHALQLSAVDQACIKLMYPPDLTKEESLPEFRKALVTAGVDKDTAGKMIRDFTKKAKGEDEAKRLTKLRKRFKVWKDDKEEHKKWLLYNRDVDILKGVDPASLRRSGISEFVGEVTKDKLFQSIMRNIIYRTMEQHGIPTNVSIPGAMQTEAMRLIGALSMHDEVGQLVRRYSIAFSGEEDDRVKTTNSTATTNG